MAVAVLATIVVATAVVVIAHPQVSRAGSSITIWQAITDQIDDGAMPTQAALEAFAYEFKIDIPGVEVPSGVDGDDVPQDGSAVVNWILAAWSDLTPAQQAVIDPFVHPGTADTVVTYPLSPSSARREPGRELAANVAYLVAPPARIRRAAVEAASTDFQNAVENDVSADITRIGQRLGLPPISEGFSLWTNITFNFSAQNGGNALMQTNAAENRAGVYSPCNITLFSNAWSGESATNGAVSPRIHVLLTHEVVHCFQNTIWGGVGVALSEPEWITEGSALWLAADDTNVQESMVLSQWRDGWFGYPEKALTNRTYDGYGYFALLDHAHRDLWGTMAAAWRAAATGGSTTSRSDAFIAVVDGDASDVRDAWAPSYLRRTEWKDPWLAYGRFLPDDAHINAHAVAALSAPGYLGDLDSRSNTVDSVDSSDGEIVLVQTDGLANAHDEQGHEDLTFQQHRFCVSGDCICPPNTAHAGERMADDDMSLPFVLAFNAPEGGARYQIVGRSLQDECGPDKDPPFPPPDTGGNGGGGARSPCPSGCAESNGDPHLVTINGYPYDFQAAGEFVAVTSADHTIEVQVRQEPYKDSDRVAINTAVAARVNGHRVGFYMSDSGVSALVDGSPTATSAVDLGAGARLSTVAKGFEVRFPDSTRLWALSLGHWGIDVLLKPSLSLAAEGRGILGPVQAHVGMPIPAMPDGSHVPKAADLAGQYDAVYGSFANAWRVAASASLFDYGAGESTATFTRANFPDRTQFISTPLVHVPDPAAIAACAAISDPRLQTQCIFDAAFTGETGFANLYAITQAFLATGVGGGSPPPVGVPSASPTPAATPSSVLPPGFMPVSSGVSLIKGTTVDSDGRLYLSFDGVDFKPQLVSVSQTGEKTGPIDAPGAGRTFLLAGSLWVAEDDPTGFGHCALVRFDPQTLNEQAKIAIGCDIAGASAVPVSDGVWWLDRSTGDINGKGGMLRHVDPQTNQIDRSVELPFLNGYLYSSSTTVVFGDPDKGWFALVAGASSFTPLGLPPGITTVFAAADGAWYQPVANSSPLPEADFVSTNSGSSKRVLIDGELVAADDQSVYVESTGVLMRYANDGSDPTQVLAATKLQTATGEQDLGYFDNDPLVAANGWVEKLWLVHDWPAVAVDSVVAQSAKLP